MKRAYKYRFYPTSEQEDLLSKTFGCARFVYNHVLAWRTSRYRNDNIRTSYPEASRRVTEIKKFPEYLWLSEVPCDALFQAIRNQQVALANFFAGRARYPSFKKKGGRQSFRIAASSVRIKDGKLYMPKCNQALRIRNFTPPPSKPINMTISKDCAGRYFVSLLYEFERSALPISPRTIGIDLGIKDLFVTDSGEKVGNPRHTAKYAKRLARAQRALSRKKLGSANRAKAKLKVARIHAKISDCRQDHLHKLSRRLINENQVICVESLKVKNMVRNRSLAKHIADASWGELVRQLRYKAEWGGRDLVQIDQFFPSSKRCSECGHTVDALPLNIREWSCPDCGALHDRDVNAARNIKAAGHAVLACGENVSLS